MALRYVARRVGVPALRRASGTSMSPSAASRPPASRSYHHQSRYSNRDAAQKMKETLGSSLTEEKNASRRDGVARIKASYQATIDAIERSKRMEKLQRLLNMGSSVAGVCLGLYIVSCIPREAMEEALRNKGKEGDHVMSGEEFASQVSFFAFTVFGLLSSSGGTCTEDDLINLLANVGHSAKDTNLAMIKFLVEKCYLKREMKDGIMWYSFNSDALKECETGLMRARIAKVVKEKGTMADFTG